MATNERVLQRLIAFEHIASVVAVNRFNRRPQTLVTPKEIKKFRANYVSLHALAKERKIYIGTMKNKLDAAGIMPAFDPKEVGARFYLRKDTGGLRLRAIDTSRLR
jgi:hypothetical protein